ncbi:hypothetical protein [Nocardia sp. NPDC020380]|uniref:hypothetical protein n=1 Tax=Nocardia sp. NPDC020380 TaxID=3364309 RepID=UPI0037AA414B
MRSSRPAALLAALCIPLSILTTGLATADPDSPDPNTGVCPYPTADNPYCTDMHDNDDGDNTRNRGDYPGSDHQQ